ncbi:MAG: right-handed parallel beta-helix repeat-containing protein [Pseudomonadota bacterium]
MNRLTLLAGALLLAGQAGAANFYVDRAGAGNLCSAERPCARIQTAISLAGSRDTVHIGAGLYRENLIIGTDKTGLVLQNYGMGEAIIESAGGAREPEAAADIILDIRAAEVRILGLGLRHPGGMAVKRDIGVYVRPGANNVTLRNLRIERRRRGADLEPTRPGSRGILVEGAAGVTIKNNDLIGNYQDHIQVPTGGLLINNVVDGATRVGIVVAETAEPLAAEENLIKANAVSNSGGDGIQIQGDNTVVQDNRLVRNRGYGIHLCGYGSSPACVAPGETAIAKDTIVKGNHFESNVQGDVADFGANNIVR